jgi:hypothetical protein
MPRSVSTARVHAPHTSSFRCFRLVPIEEPGFGAYETVELCEPRRNMRALTLTLKSAHGSRGLDDLRWVGPRR